MHVEPSVFQHQLFSQMKQVLFYPYTGSMLLNNGLGQLSFQHQIHRCDDAEWAEIGYIIEDCNFSQWNNEYLASSEGDGCRVWEMKLQNNNKTVKKSYGHQKYPNSWMTFEALEAQCLLLFGIEKDYPV